MPPPTPTFPGAALALLLDHEEQGTFYPVLDLALAARALSAHALAQQARHGTTPRPGATLAELLRLCLICHATDHPGGMDWEGLRWALLDRWPDPARVE